MLYLRDYISELQLQLIILDLLWHVVRERLKDVTYIKFVCNVRTEKKDPNRTRATIGGNLINYPEDVGTLTANLLLIKIFLNSVISTRGAKFAGADLANF